jgi:hypothetical protein
MYLVFPIKFDKKVNDRLEFDRITDNLSKKLFKYMLKNHATICKKLGISSYDMELISTFSQFPLSSDREKWWHEGCMAVAYIDTTSNNIDEGNYGNVEPIIRNTTQCMIATYQPPSIKQYSKCWKC